MTSSMTLVDPKDHILKVSCHYLYILQRYKGVTKRNKYVTEDRQTHTAQFQYRIQDILIKNRELDAE